MFIVLTVGDEMVRVSVDKIISYKEYTDTASKTSRCTVKLFGADHLYVKETAQDIDKLLREAYIFVGRPLTSALQENKD